MPEARRPLASEHARRPPLGAQTVGVWACASSAAGHADRRCLGMAGS
jgi:hypothetical protein